MEKSELKHGQLFTVGDFGVLPLKGFMEMPEHNGVVKIKLYFHSPEKKIIEADPDDVELIKDAVPVYGIGIKPVGYTIEKSE